MVPMRQERPYHSDSTASRLLSEVKHCRARLVLRWGTTLESLVLFFCSCCLLFWPLRCLQYDTLLHFTRLLPFFCSAFRSLRSNMKKLAALNLYCVSHRPAMLSSVSSRCILMKDVKSSTCCCWSSFGSFFMRSVFPFMRLAPARFESVVNLSLHLYQPAVQRQVKIDPSQRYFSQLQLVVSFRYSTCLITWTRERSHLLRYVSDCGGTVLLIMYDSKEEI